MALRVIQIDPADTFYSLRDRVLRNGRARTVLVLPPGDNPPVTEIDLVLLRRLADRERLDLGLVTSDRRIAGQARGLGLPAFASVTLAEHYRPGWWRAGKRSERVGFMPGEAHEFPPESTPRSRRAWFLMLLVAVFLLAGLFTGTAIYALPRATVMLRPKAVPVQSITDLRADPAAAESFGNVIPARSVQADITWEVTGPVTGDALADQKRMQALARQGIATAAPDLLAARLDPGDLLVPDSAGFDIIAETFDQTGSESALTLDATLEGLVVSSADMNRLAFRVLAAALPDNFVPDAATMRIQLSGNGDATNNRFQITANATGRGQIDTPALGELLRGRRIEEARSYLAGALPADVTLIVGPDWWATWFGRLPLRSDRIVIEQIP